MQEIYYLTEYTIKISYQELLDIQLICNEILIRNPQLKDKHNTEYDNAEKYYKEIDKIMNKKYEK
jgi:hypothetical protein